MNLRRPLVLALICFVAVPLGRAQSVTVPESLFGGLQPVLAGALDQSPRMLGRSLDLEAARQDRVGARSGLLPNVGGGFRYQEGREERVNLDPYNASKVYYDVTLTQPVFHWGERRNNNRIGEIRLKIAEENYADAYRILAQELRQRYLNLIVIKLNRERTRTYARFAESQLRIAEDRHAKKIIADAALSAAQTTNEQAIISRDRAEFDLEQGRLDFARLAGLRSFEESDIPDAIPALKYDGTPYGQMLGAFLSAGDLPTPEVENLKRLARIEELNYANSKTRLRPKVNLTSGITQDEQSYSIDFSERFLIKYAYVGVSVSWTLFDGFAAQAGRRAARARQRRAEHDYHEAIDRVSRVAQTQARYIDFSARHMALADRTLAAAEGLVPVRRDELARGIVSESDVTVAELALFDARIAAYYARIDLLIKTTEFLGLLDRDPVLAHVPSNR